MRITFSAKEITPAPLLENYFHESLVAGALVVLTV